MTDAQPAAAPPASAGGSGTEADADFSLALVEEAAKKSGLIWVRGTGGDAPERALWHIWHEGAAHVVGDGPGEQPLPGLVAGGTADITVRSKDKGGRLVSWSASVTELAPRSEAWESAVAELKSKRLNAADTEGLPELWAGSCRVLRLAPVSVAGSLPDGSLAVPPAATPATTRRPIPAALPSLLLRRRRRD
ncbi:MULTISPECIES: hypothetical protein [Streptomyces]|uniref:hypothetical protein n=1 Tax=Streptomyces TaxID=1883 RepID=UPI00025CD402|nr:MULTISPECIES: hypothetical protein [Streptomyces]EIF92348.1 hypothetical protein [Streptomyces tsukubensis NRRL18488]